MRPFYFPPPLLGLRFATERLTSVRIRRHWLRRHISVKQVQSLVLPKGLIVPSALGTNVTDVGALAEAIGTLAASASPCTVSITLPDACARLALLRVEALLDSPEDMERLIRWRLKETAQEVPPDAEIRYRVYAARTPLLGKPEPLLTGASILACALKRSILQDYERACWQADLTPVSIGLECLHLFDLCRPCFGGAREAYFVSITESELLLIALSDGQPVFLRSTLLRQAHADWIPTVLTTIDYCRDKVLRPMDADPMRRIPVVATCSDPAILDAVIDPEALGGRSHLHVMRLDRSATVLDWDHASAPCPGDLAAMAGLKAA